MHDEGASRSEKGGSPRCGGFQPDAGASRILEGDSRSNHRGIPQMRGLPDLMRRWISRLGDPPGGFLGDPPEEGELGDPPIMITG